MEQLDTPLTEVLQSEGSATDVDARTIHVTEIAIHQEAKDTAAIESNQELQNVGKQEFIPAANNTDDNVESKSDDSTAAANSDVFLDKVHSDISDHLTCDSINLDIKNDMSGNESIETYDHIKHEIVDSNYESQSLSNEEDQSQNVITESEAVEEKEEVMHDANNDADMVEEPSQSDAVVNQLDKVMPSEPVNELSEVQTCDSHESVKETIKEIHENDGNQNSSIVTNAELTKLVNEETEGVVVVEETIPVVDEVADDFIISVDEDSASNACNQETVSSVQEKAKEKSTVSAEIIDCSQESGGTIIEVITTEIVHSPVAEQRQNSEDSSKDNTCDTKTMKLTDGEVTTDKDVTDENSSENLVNSVSKEEGAKGTAIIIDEKIIIMEDASPEAMDLSRADDASKHANKKTNISQEAKEVVTPATEGSKKRSVIQDIFDDWDVENTDEDAQSTSKEHDSVEIELKSLLDETKSDQSVVDKPLEDAIPSANKKHVVDDTRKANAIEKSTTKKSTGRSENQKKSKTVVNQDATSLERNEFVKPATPPVSRPSRGLNATLKNRTRHLTSQIASPAEVTEVLKERLREKQKVVVDAPRSPDIFFVKKLTQRLSSKLAGNPIPSPANQMPSLPQQPAASPLSSTPAPLTVENCDKSATIENTTTETSKEGNSDNKELLAILEGDVDPDWSILKPPTLTEESKTPSNVEHSDHAAGPPKLDPLVEREMALKQLLELPVTASKKSTTRKKKTFKPAPGKASKDTGTKTPILQDQKKVIDVDLSEQDDHKHEHVEINLVSPPREQNRDSKNQDADQTSPTSRAEESRSGRKRKLTEKAREQEQQNTIKRQKVYKGKVAINKKQTSEINVASNNDSMIEDLEMTNPSGIVDDNEEAVAKEEADKQLGKTEPTLSKPENSLLKRPKQSLARKDSPPVTKRKVVVKKLLRQKMSPNKKTVKLKAKLSTSPKKSPPKVIPKTQKRAAENLSGDVKPKKKSINEIDRLLQDEGVVNLLYDVEQPDKKRLVPITKSRAKVMDLQKVQRELKIRKKLVRNAVLRLRTPSGSVTKVSPRSKRTAGGHLNDVDKKMMEQIASSKTPNAASPTEFIVPAKIRNAADASIIIRRHSSSSFSSASGSPRVSTDSPDKSVTESIKDDGAVHSLRSAKRRHSQDEKVNTKKSKKKAEKPEAIDATATSTSTTVTSVTTSTTTTTTTTINAIANNAEEKAVVAMRPSKKSEIKKVDKAAKQQEHIPALENNVTSSKVTTRSNGAATGKVTAKSKRTVKSKVSFVKPNEAEDSLDSSKEEAELSACLAEAATALAIVNAGRSGNNANTRKSKGKGKMSHNSFLIDINTRCDC